MGIYNNAKNNTFENKCDPLPKSTLISRNITVLKRRTSVRLEPEMWVALKEISDRENCSIHDICSLISLRKHSQTSLTAAIRVFLMLYFRAATTEEGHKRAGHGSFEVMKRRAKISPPLNPLKGKQAANLSDVCTVSHKPNGNEGIAAY